MRFDRTWAPALSLMAAALVSVLWMRSDRRAGEALVYCDRTPRRSAIGKDRPVWHQYSLCSFRGRIGVERRAFEDIEFLRGNGYQRDGLFINMYGPTPWEAHGFCVYQAYRSDLAVGRMGVISSETIIDGATLPHWFVLAGCLVFPGWRVIRAICLRGNPARRGFPLRIPGAESGAHHARDTETPLDAG